MFKGFILSIVIALLLVGAAYAGEIEIGGSLEVDGVLNRNFDCDNNVSDTLQYWYQELLLAPSVKISDRASVYAQMTVSSGVWGAANTVEADWGTVRLADADYAYMDIAIGPGRLAIGLQSNNWGNKLLTWEDSVDRAKYTVTMGDVEFGGYTQKDVESNSSVTNDGFGNIVAPGHNDEDDDGYGVFVTGKSENMSGGVLVTYNDDNAHDYDAAMYNGAATGGWVDVFGNAKLGDMDVEAEAVYGYGARSKDAGGNNAYAAFASVSNEMEALTVNALAAYAANGYIADDQFNPTLFIGTDQFTAIREFEVDPLIDGDSTWLLTLGAVYKVSDSMTLGGRAAYWVVSGKNDESATEFDATFEYELSEGVTWSAGLGYLIPDGMSATDDPALTTAHTLLVEF